MPILLLLAGLAFIGASLPSSEKLSEWFTWCVGQFAQFLLGFIQFLIDGNKIGNVALLFLNSFFDIVSELIGEDGVGAIESFKSFLNGSTFGNILSVGLWVADQFVDARILAACFATAITLYPVWFAIRLVVWLWDKVRGAGG